MISNVGGYLAGVGFDKSKGGVAEVASAKDAAIIPGKDNPAGANRGGSVSISTLAGQLAYSASDSAEKNKGLGHAELAAKAARTLDTILYELTPANVAKAASEVPNTTDPALLKRAQLATAFVNGGRKDNVGSEPNPFAGLSREQLANIAYDESGTFTTNERRAAYSESALLELQWRVKVVAKMTQDYNSTGNLTDCFQEILDHFKELPAMEQAQYPKNYASDLTEKIKLNFNYRTGHPDAKRADVESGIIPQIIASVLPSAPDIFKPQ